MLRKIKRRFGISAPQVAVRLHVAWYWRWLGILALITLATLLAWWGYDVGRRYSGFDKSEVEQELLRLNERASHLQQENAALRTEATGAERQLQIERAAYADLARQLKSLEEENTRIKEDLAFFQSLMSPGNHTSGFAVYRFRVERDKQPGEYRFGLLLVQTGTRAKDFQGRLQLVANVVENGGKTTINVSDSKNPKTHTLNFKYYQRVEGSFKLPPNVAVESLQVRVFENGAPGAKVTQTANLS